MYYLILISIIILNYAGPALADHASASFETGSAGAIMTVPGTTMPKGKLVAGVGIQSIEFDEISDAQLQAFGAVEEEVHSVKSLLNVSVNFAYGISDKLTVGIILPYVQRSNIRETEHDMGTGEAELAGDARGLGNLTLFGQYRFYHDNASDAAAILAGLKTPTGKTSEQKIEASLFEAEQQPGSGSWDPFLGLAYNKQFGRSGFSGNLLYTFVTEGTQQTDLGDIFNYNLAVSYRVYSPQGGHDHGQHAHALKIIDYIDVAVELNGGYRDHAVINGARDENTGGHILYLSPGVRIGLAHQWSLFTSIGIAVLNDLNGQQSEPDYRIISGISAAF